ncbi:MAG: sporulation protein YqfD [Lachnospira sp.]
MNNKSKHFLKIRLSGEDSFRFLNICLKNDIKFFNIHFFSSNNDEERDYMEFFMSVKDFYKIRRPVRLTGVRVRIVKKYGPGFILHRYRKHFSFVIGIALAVVIIKITGMYLWNISIEGNFINSDSQVIKVLSDNNIAAAMKTSDIDCIKTEEILKNNLSEIAWINVRVQGSSLIINVKENISKDKLNESGTENTSLIANNSGIISSIVTRKGTPLVKEGDNVEIGDVLVKGIVDINDDNGEVTESKGICADADVYIITKLTYEDTVNLKKSIIEYDGDSVKKYFVGFNNKKYKAGLKLKDNCEYTKVEEINNVKFGKYLYSPIIYGVEEYFSYSTVEVNLSTEEGKNELNERLSAYLRKLNENGVQILDYRVNINTGASTMTLQSEITAKILQTTSKMLDYQGDADG